MSLQYETVTCPICGNDQRKSGRRVTCHECGFVILEPEETELRGYE